MFTSSLTRRDRAVTAKDVLKKCTARAKLLFSLLNVLLVRYCSRHSLALLLNLRHHGSNTALRVPVTSLKMHGGHFTNFLFWHLIVLRVKN